MSARFKRSASSPNARADRRNWSFSARSCSSSVSYRSSWLSRSVIERAFRESGRRSPVPSPQRPAGLLEHESSVRVRVGQHLPQPQPNTDRVLSVTTCGTTTFDDSAMCDVRFWMTRYVDYAPALQSQGV